MNIRVYIAGYIIIAPVFIGLMSDSVVLIMLSLLYGLALYYSPKVSTTARKFWRAWHKANFTVINLIK